MIRLEHELLVYGEIFCLLQCFKAIPVIIGTSKSNIRLNHHDYGKL